MLRVGIIGCGGISRAHVRGWTALADRARVVAVADLDARNAGEVASLVGGAEILADFRDLVARNDVDAVDICLPHHLHRDAIVAAARAGKHILCEKPLCLSLREAEEIAAAVSGNGVTFMSAHNQVFLPTVREARSLLDAGFLGDLYALYSSDCFVHPQTQLSEEQKRALGRTWRSSKATMGGGEFIDTGYHPTYRLLYLAGSAPVEVVGFTARYRLHHWDEEDTGQAMVRFASGALGTVLSSWAMPNPYGDYYFCVLGERGQMFGTPDTLTIHLNGAEPEIRSFAKVDTFAAEIAHFVDTLAAGGRPIQSVAEATTVLKVILGAYRSIDEKRVIAIESLVDAPAAR